MDQPLNAGPTLQGKSLGGGFFITPLHKDHDRKKFDCGNADINRFLRDQAGQDRKRSISATYVMVHEDLPSEIVGYYTLAPTPITAPGGSPLANYPHPLTAQRLARLGVSNLYRGNNLGAALVVHAIETTAKIARMAGGIGLFVDPKDEGLAEYYARLGFRSVAGMLESWLPIAECLNAFPKT